MGGEDKVIKILKDRNPFSSQAAGGPWEERYPDVPGLGDDVFFWVKSLIAGKAKPPHDPCAALVLGDAGSGKTHLIGRLVDDGEQAGVQYSCAYIQPLIDPHRAFRYLLKEIITNLTKKPRKGPELSQLEILSGRIISRVLRESAPKAGKAETMLKFADLIDKDPARAIRMKGSDNSRAALMKITKSYLRDRHGDLDPDFLNVFLQHYLFPKRRAAALDWLKGCAVDQDDIKLLGVQDRSALQPQTLESEARDMLHTLDVLLGAYSGRPLVIFFDQLENLESQELIVKFCQLIYFLSDTCKAMLPLAFFREIEWEERFLPAMDASCSGRLKSNTAKIRWATRDQARELIQSRLDFVLGGTRRKDPLYPFLPDHQEPFDKIMAYEEMFPRQVLARANRLLEKIINEPPKPKDPLKAMADAYESRRQEILSSFDDYPPDEGRLTLALEKYLAHRPKDGPYRFDSLKPSAAKVKYIDLEGNLKLRGKEPEPVVFMVDVEHHNMSVGASLERGLKHQANRGGKAYALYVRDGRCAFPATWKVNNQKLKMLRDQGGEGLFLDAAQAAGWYALARLKFDVEAGDVTDADGRMLGRETFETFIGQRLNGKDHPAFQPVDDYFLNVKQDESRAGEPVRSAAVGAGGPRGIVKAAAHILDKSPAKMMKADFLAARVSKRLKVELHPDDMLLALGRTDLFSTYGAPPGIIVQLQIRKYHDKG